MLLSFLLPVVALFIPLSLAVFADDAYHVDFHNALLGIPSSRTTFFHQPFQGSKASLIYTIGDKSVLGAVNPKDGAIVWRQPLAEPSNVTDAFLSVGQGQDTVVSGIRNSVAAWGAGDGKLVWRKSFEGAGPIKDLEVLELAESDTEKEKDSLVVFGGATPVVRRLNGKTGAVVWEHEDNSGDEPFQIAASSTGIFYITLHTSMLGGLKIRITSLDVLKGTKLDQYTLNSDSELPSAQSILFVGANSASPVLCWTDKHHKVLKVNIIGTRPVSSFNLDNANGEDIEKIIVHAPRQINSVPHFLVHYQTPLSHWAEVYHVDLKTSSVAKAYSLPKLVGNGAFSTSTSGVNVYFTRFTREELLVVSSVSHGVLGRFAIKDFTIPGLLDDPRPVHAISEVVLRSGAAHAVRCAVLFSSGDWVLLRNSEISWTRPESLSGITTAVWAELPDTQDLAYQLDIEGHQNVLTAYVHRVRRHIKDFEHLPTWIQNLPARITRNFLGDNEKRPSAELQRDSFGFRKLVIIATDNGRIAALDVGSSGRTVWSVEIVGQELGSRWAAPQLEADPQGFVTVRYGVRHLLLNTTTGVFLSESDPPPVEIKQAPGNSAAITYELIEGEVRGFFGGDATPIWKFLPAIGEHIINIVSRPVDDPVASIGKVLGDRSVLYKYLNPNIALVTAINQGARSTSVYILDTISGNVIFSNTHEGIDTSQDIAAAISENWFTYSYTIDTASHIPSSRGFALVVGELYESSLPNDRGPLSTGSNASSIEPLPAGDALKPHVLTQTYHIPERISHMAVTHTRQGITSRQLLATLPGSNSIVGIPKQVIDPRRPVGRDATAQESSEGLTKYLPYIDFDPKWYLNHKRELLGIENVITSPSLLESTSLVFAYGIDVFGTRVSPSFSFDILGKGFNKIQMVSTVAALAIGVLFVAPLVKRKQINAQWQIS
ncbi:DUF1620-domain-containing protein [Patellaria atrata CBS 101060]|uniref:ER membrane protein complex subunit 1 n=1 Tax=Patellaria atrata CBS 101060 TaxID=1346257 RepID=A0A9P4SHK8_9PEZI|nr:DUF1620-domain-containing protein [Patellaria atrata CBS 101060]